MQIFYFVQIAGRDTGTSGIPRVVRGLGRALLESSAASIVPVRWNAERSEIVYAEQIFLDTLAIHNGPVFAANKQPGRPIDTAASAGDWLLIPEVPHLKSHDPRYPSVSIGGPIAYARKRRLRAAVVFHDILPLTNPELNDATDVKAAAAERRDFVNYARALLEADLVLPVSSFTEASLCRWLKSSGYPTKSWPHLAAIELPAELTGWARQVPDVAKSTGPQRGFGFVCFGTICSRKNQLSVIEGFNRLIEAKPDLPITLHVVGHVEPALRPSFDGLIRHSSGRVHHHGFLSDGELAWLISGSRASIFVSKAEGYGLPIGESLWLGTPCLCSNIPPMVDIARTGGCLTVDPYDVDAIAAGINRLATDETCYRRLLTELAARDLKTWADYGAGIFSALERRTPKAQRQLRRSQPRPAASAPVARTIGEPTDPSEHPFLLRRAGNQIVSVRRREAGDLAIFDFGTVPVPRRRLLVMKLDHIGDFVMALPSLQKLRSAFPADHITYLCGPWNSDFARAAGIADEVRNYRFYAEDASQWDGQPVEDIATFRRVAEGTFDIAIDLRVDEDTRFLLQHVDARMKCGIGTRARHPFLDVVLAPQFEQREAADDFGEPRLIKPSRFQSRMPLQTPFFHETDFSVTNTHVIFGPDLELPAGRFRATWDLQLVTALPRFCRANIDVDVARGSGSQIVNACHVNWRQPLHFPLTPAVEFDNERAGAPHEFRVHVRGRPFATRLRFFGVLVEELGHVPVNRFKPSELHVGEQLSLLVQLVEDRARPLKGVEPFAGGTDVAELDILPAAAKRIVVAPMSNSRLRDWGLDNYARLAELLLKRQDCAIILVGSATQRDLLARIAVRHEAEGMMINLAGRTDWLQTVEVIRQADLVICNNSGIAHIAAACGTATLAIYSASHEPQEWGPRGNRARAMMALVPCSRCSYEKLEMCQYDHRCMRLIAPEAVAAEAASMLMGFEATTSNAVIA